MENKQPLLSMCIPTYNGGDKLEICLDKLFTSIAGNMDVEVIVSDNCSTDNTQEIIKKYKTNSCFRYYRNDTNVGFNGNLLLLIDNYAKGDYCWVIGDDDFLDSDAISNVIKILKNEIPSHISISHRFIDIKDINIDFSRNREIQIFRGSFFQCMDYNVCSSNVLGTFMSSHIFKLQPVREFDKSFIRDNNWKDFINVFPNSYIMTQCFYNDHYCVKVTSPLLSVLIHKKSWDDKLDDIKVKILPEGLSIYSKLINNKGLLVNNRNLIYKDALSVIKQNLIKFRLSSIHFSLFFHSELYKSIISIIKTN